MSKVIPIRGGGVVDALEELLEDARNGKIIALAFAAIEEDDVAHEGVCGDVNRCAVALYGAVNILRDMYFHMHIEHNSNADVGDV